MSPPRKIALVDANSFYCSAEKVLEKVFRPDLTKVPVVILSNNDGCVIARDAMSKALGIPMIQPRFRLKADMMPRRLAVQDLKFSALSKPAVISEQSPIHQK